MATSHRYRLPRLLFDPALSVPPAYLNRTNDASYNGDANFDSNMVIILAALLCALICALGLNSIVRCARRCTSTFTYDAADVVLASSSVKKETLSQIPVVAYKPGMQSPAVDCPICLAEFVEGEAVRILPGCKHGFHVKCIDRWLLLQSSCPVCRQPLTEPSVAGNNAEDVRVQVD